MVCVFIRQLVCVMVYWFFGLKQYYLILGFLLLFLGSVVGEMIIFVVYFEDVDVMGQFVEQCVGEVFGVEGFGLFIEGQIVGN